MCCLLKSWPITKSEKSAEKYFRIHIHQSNASQNVGQAPLVGKRDRWGVTNMSLKWWWFAFISSYWTLFYLMLLVLVPYIWNVIWLIFCWAVRGSWPLKIPTCGEWPKMFHNHCMNHSNFISKKKCSKVSTGVHTVDDEYEHNVCIL